MYSSVKWPAGGQNWFSSLCFSDQHLSKCLQTFQRLESTTSLFAHPLNSKCTPSPTLKQALFDASVLEKIYYHPEKCSDLAMSEEAFFIMMCRIERLWMFSTLICVTDVPQLEFSKEQLCQRFKKSPPLHLLWLTSLAQHTISHQFSVFSFHPKRTPEK